MADLTAAVAAFADFDYTKEPVVSPHRKPLLNLTEGLFSYLREQWNISDADLSVPSVRRITRDLAKLLAREVYDTHLLKAVPPTPATSYAEYLAYINGQYEPRDKDLVTTRCRLGAALLRARYPMWTSTIDAFVATNPRCNTLLPDFHDLVAATVNQSVANSQRDAAIIKAVKEVGEAVASATKASSAMGQPTSSANTSKKKQAWIPNNAGLGP